MHRKFQLCDLVDDCSDATDEVDCAIFFVPLTHFDSGDLKFTVFWPGKSKTLNIVPGLMNILCDFINQLVKPIVFIN